MRYNETASKTHGDRMKSLADDLPPEIAQQIHPDWRKNEVDYWSVRDQLRGQYHGQWIAFAEGAVVCAAARPLEVFLAVQDSGGHPFVTRVGHEDEPWYRIRRSTFDDDTAYPTTALPVLSAEFRSRRGTAGSLLDRVIPDTGADATTLPWPDCQQLRLDPAQGVPGIISGVAAPAAKLC
jgi:hypothetical protein